MPSKLLKHSFFLFSIISVFTLLMSKALNNFSPYFFTNIFSYCKSLIINNTLGLSQELEGLSISLISGLIISITLIVLINLFKIKKYKDKLKNKEIVNSNFNKLVKEEGLLKKTCLVKDDIPYAFCIGLLNPKIYISEKMIKITNKSELKAILVHEKHHLNSKDPLISFLFSVARPFLLVFPLLSDIERNYKIEREIEADKKAFEEINNKKSIVSALEKLITFRQSNPQHIIPMADNKTIEPRINALINTKYTYQKFRLSNIVTSVFIFVVLITFAALPIKAFGEKSLNQSIAKYCNSGNINPKTITNILYTSSPSFSSVK